MNRKYLAFDIEIGFNFDRIDANIFTPEDGENVLLVQEIINEDGEREEIWVDAKYIGGIIKRFRLQDGELVTGTYWKYQGNDWKRFRPLGITCAAAASSDGGLWNWWATKEGRFTNQMSKGDCQLLVLSLDHLVKEAGYTILTWNGLGFDFDILAEESGMHDECKALSLGHIDMMFHFFASKGYPLGLDAASKGMGLPGKPEGMTGAKAPVLWADGQYHRVLDYVSWDCKNTLGVAKAVDLDDHLFWTARSGRPNSWNCQKWLTVKEAMELPEPDTGWMSDPWPRDKFYEWTGYKPPVETVTPIDEVPDDMKWHEDWEEDGD